MFQSVVLIDLSSLPLIHMCVCVCSSLVVCCSNVKEAVEGRDEGVRRQQLFQETPGQEKSISSPRVRVSLSPASLQGSLLSREVRRLLLKALSPPLTPLASAVQNWHTQPVQPSRLPFVFPVLACLLWRRHEARSADPVGASASPERVPTSMSKLGCLSALHSFLSLSLLASS